MCHDLTWPEFKVNEMHLNENYRCTLMIIMDGMPRFIKMDVQI
jgi:hypothetical protein